MPYLSISNLTCCGVQQINGIQTYLPEEMNKAMQQVCQHMFHRQRMGFLYDKHTGQPYSFYVFNGVVGYKKGYKDADKNTKYVQAFRSFILKNKLGDVTTSKLEWNRVNNPEHKLMMCVWRPDPKACKAWFKKNPILQNPAVPPAPYAPIDNEDPVE